MKQLTDIEVASIRQALLTIGGEAKLIMKDRRSHSIIAYKAKTIASTVGIVLDLLGKDTKTQEGSVE